MAHDTTPYFDAFNDEVQKWLERFGLKSWAVRVMLCDPQEGENVRAYVSCFPTSRRAEIKLLSAWADTEDAPSEYQVRRSAFHEVCELLLVRAGCIAFNQEARGEDWEEETHVIIRTLENAVFDREWVKTAPCKHCWKRAERCLGDCTLFEPRQNGE